MSASHRTGGANVGRGVGALAAAVLVLAWMLGSTALAILGLGLGLAALGARGWASVVRRGLEVERRPAAAPTEEGQPIRFEVAVRGRMWLASGVELVDRVGPLGERRVVLGRGGRGTLTVDAAPRGRYPLGPGQLLVDDPLGLSRVELAVPEGGAMLVRPRVPELPTVFTDSGGYGSAGRRQPLPRPSGLEPHGVREHLEGEPLRAVHWPSSARRGRLMVRELEEAPRESVAVVLDVERSAIAGPPGSSSLDDAVRAAAGILRAYVSRSRRALLAIATPAPTLHRVEGLGPSWEAALDVLAAVEPAEGGLLEQLVTARGQLATIAELVVVTSRPHVVATVLAARASGNRRSALVAVDAPTYVGREPASTSPEMLRLSAAGVVVAVVRRDTVLEDALSGLRPRAVG